MSATTLASPITKSWNGLRTLLIAVTIVLLAALAFAGGRATVSSHTVRTPIVVSTSGGDSPAACPVVAHVC